MTKRTKIQILYPLSILITYISLHFIFSYLFQNVDNTYITGLVALITVIISPRFKTIKTQSGNKIQMTWIFQKKAKTF